jgi:signal transduction histidine kinase
VSDRPVLKRWLQSILPNRIGGQILLLVAVSVVLTQALSFAFLLSSDQGRREESQLRAGLGIFMSGVRMLAAANPDDWATVGAIVKVTQPGIDFTFQPDGEWKAPSHEEGAPTNFIARDLGPGYAVEESQLLGRPGSATDFRRISVLLPNHVVVSAKLLLPSPPLRAPIPAWSLFTFALVFLPLMFFWAAWGLSRQLNNFARAAADFSLEGEHSVLPETGPEEIQQVARALNRMRDRIAGLLADRTRMLSAIGHDLRTPITRLRLRAEFIEDEHPRLDILKDLDRMNRMVNSALTYLRDGSDSEKPIPIDLPALLRTVGDNFIDVGEKVSYEGVEHLSVTARPDALVRAVENLVENALKYGSQAVLRSGREDATRVYVEVEDDGIGIASEQREAMLQPFVRGDAARNSQAGGFGLGLSITASIARSHGGELLLSTGKMGGLVARLVLPGHDDEPRAAAQRRSPS